MLDVLGLDDLEATAYRRLVEVPHGTADELATMLGSEVGEARQSSARSRRRDWSRGRAAARAASSRSPPAIALGALVVQRQEELRSAQLELAALTERYRSAAGERSVSDVVDVVRGPQAVGQRFQQLQRTAEHEVQMLVRADFVAVPPRRTRRGGRRRSGCHYRVVVERANLELPGFFEGAVASIKHRGRGTGHGVAPPAD